MRTGNLMFDEGEDDSGDSGETSAFAVAGEDMLAPGEACAMLKCEWLTLRGMLRDGRFPGLKISKEWVIPRRAFIQRMNELALEEAAARRDRFATANVTAAHPAPTQPSAPPPGAAQRNLHPRWEKYTIKPDGPVGKK
jgi:hypothetical protein